MPRWSVTADDRTGSFEIAAFLAARDAPVTVSAHPDVGGDVVDLGSRPLDPADAARRAGGVGRSAWDAHKIDSTLRGNWADEVRARCASTGRPAVLVPAWPAMGRTCVGGEVHVGGRRVAGVADGMPEAVLLADAAALADWLASDSLDRRADGSWPVASVDVADDEGLRAVAAAMRDAPVLASGPAGALGAVHAAVFGEREPAPLPVGATAARTVLVVCASATAVSRRQVEVLRGRRPDVPVLAAPAPAAGTALHAGIAAELADRVGRVIAGFDAVVIVGGDTAAAVLGDSRRIVGGFARPGTPWSLGADGSGPLVVTKAGGFGDDLSLVHLVDLLVG